MINERPKKNVKNGTTLSVPSVQIKTIKMQRVVEWCWQLGVGASQLQTQFFALNK